MEEKRKRKGERYFSVLYGGVPLRVSILKENTKETYIRFPAILYLVPRREVPFIFRQRGVIALSEKAGIPGKRKETGAGVF